MQRADYTLVTRQNRNGTLLVGGFGGDGAGGGTDEEPFGECDVRAEGGRFVTHRPPVPESYVRGVMR
jgi:hypothetical protein